MHGTSFIGKIFGSSLSLIGKMATLAASESRLYDLIIGEPCAENYGFCYQRRENEYWGQPTILPYYLCHLSEHTPSYSRNVRAHIHTHKTPCTWEGRCLLL